MFVIYFIYDFEMVPVARVVNSVTFHMCSIAIVKSAYFKTFFGSFLSQVGHATFSLSQSMETVLMLAMVLSVFVC
jgi:hypothetical protein